MIKQFNVGEIHELDGFCTKAFLVRGRPPLVLDSLLGYRPGRLAAGATILFLEDLPTPEDFILAGYSQFSGGAVRGHEIPEDQRDEYMMESLLKSEHGWTDAQLRDQKKRMIGSTIVVKGPERIVKVIPTTTHSPTEEYPPGKGIFQIKLVRPRKFRVKASISAGQTWIGDFE